MKDYTPMLKWVALIALGVIVVIAAIFVTINSM